LLRTLVTRCRGLGRQFLARIFGFQQDVDRLTGTVPRLGVLDRVERDDDLALSARVVPGPVVVWCVSPDHVQVHFVMARRQPWHRSVTPSLSYAPIYDCHLPHGQPGITPRWVSSPIRSWVDTNRKFTGVGSAGSRCTRPRRSTTPAPSTLQRSRRAPRPTPRCHRAPSTPTVHAMPG